MSVQPGDLITHVHLYRILQELPQYGSLEGHLWDTLFPPDFSPSPHLMWKVLRGSDANLAGFISNRGVAKPIEGLESDREFADMANIGASWRVDPEVVRQANDPGAASLVAIEESPAGQALLQLINDEMIGGATTCLEMMERQREYMAMQAISTGAIVWPPLAADGTAITNPMEHWNADMEISFTYTMDADFVQDATTLYGYDTAGGEVGGQIAWDQPGAKIITDMRLINRFMREKYGLNAKGGRVIMTPYTLEKMVDNAEFREMVIGTDKQRGDQYLDYDTVVNFVMDRLGWTIVEYNASPWTYRTWSSGRAVLNPVKFLADGKVIFIPAGVTPGNMMESLVETQEGRYAAGNVPWFKRDDEPPYNRRGGVRAVGWPAFPYSKQIFILNAFA